MKITEIIKDAFLFPSKNTGRYAIYLLLSVLASLFALGGVFTYILGIIDAENYLTGGIYIIISLLILIIISGYHIKIIKSGINLDDNVPVFELFEDFMTGFDNFIVLMFYMLIPTLIVALVGLDTNIFGKAIALGQEIVLQVFNVFIMGNSANIAVNAISNALNNLMGSLAVTIIAALVLYVIFGFILSMAESRLANTGSLKEALNIFETIKDITRIGAGKVILVILLVFILIIILEIILTFILNRYPFLLTTFGIIITPYFILVTQRAIGLLYSDIT
ncbi:DUF4013 domain-containing protein [Methanobrevibacter sp.]|uniref:DUF4013 domain-containing protein n=1 Tax=Methanobrevibacter sp. TaxID=66852 RepID=UPI00388D122F